MWWWEDNSLKEWRFNVVSVHLESDLSSVVWWIPTATSHQYSNWIHISIKLRTRVSANLVLQIITYILLSLGIYHPKILFDSWQIMQSKNQRLLLWHRNGSILRWKFLATIAFQSPKEKKWQFKLIRGLCNLLNVII